MGLRLCSTKNSGMVKEGGDGWGILPEIAKSNANDSAEQNVKNKLVEWINANKCDEPCKTLSNFKTMASAGNTFKPKRVWRFFFIFVFWIIPIPILAMVWTVKAKYIGDADIACICTDEEQENNEGVSGEEGN